MNWCNRATTKSHPKKQFLTWKSQSFLQNIIPNGSCSATNHWFSLGLKFFLTKKLFQQIFWFKNTQKPSLLNPKKSFCYKFLITYPSRIPKVNHRPTQPCQTIPIQFKLAKNFILYPIPFHSLKSLLNINIKPLIED